MDRTEAKTVADAFSRDLVQMIEKWVDRLDELEAQGHDWRPLMRHLGAGLVESGQKLKKLAKEA